MNERKKFTGGHVFAIVAILFVAYVTFMGLTFLTSGRFIIAGIWSFVTVIILAFCFFGAQRLKTTEHNFKEYIRRERILVYATPFIFIVLMLPFTHFWTVHSHQDEVVSKFSEAVIKSKNVFAEYENYANTRIENYQSMLSDVENSSISNDYDYMECGFVDGITANTMVQTLRVQLLSENYNELKSEACRWIETASRGTSTWNVFLIGNMREIDKALEQWQDYLAGFAGKKLSNEEFKGRNKVESFENVSSTIAQARAILKEVDVIYRDFNFPCFLSIVLMLLTFAALSLPYYSLSRNTKSRYTFWGEKNANVKDEDSKTTIVENQSARKVISCDLDLDEDASSEVASDWTTIEI